VSAVAFLPRNGSLIFTTKVKTVGDDLFVYLDTHMFASSSARKNCYPLPIEEMRQLQEDLLLHLIESKLKRGDFSRIVFVGHHPLCVFPFEKNMSYRVEPTLIQLISTLLQLWEDAPRFVYLCSHDSVYQEQVIDLGGQEIHMHIAGTGGAGMSSPEGGGSNRSKQSKHTRKSSTKEIDYDAAAGVISMPSLLFSALLIRSVKEHGYLFLPGGSKEIRFRPLFLPEIGGRTRRRQRRTKHSTLVVNYRARSHKN
jgi:hypothetical protein